MKYVLVGYDKDGDYYETLKTDNNLHHLIEQGERILDIQLRTDRYRTQTGEPFDWFVICDENEAAYPEHTHWTSYELPEEIRIQSFILNGLNLNQQASDELVAWAHSLKETKDKDLEKFSNDIIAYASWTEDTTTALPYYKQAMRRLYQMYGMNFHKAAETFVFDSAEQNIALGFLLHQAAIQEPIYVKRPQYAPAICPNCGVELSEHHGDGYYTHPTWQERCPECGQAITWKYEK